MLNKVPLLPVALFVFGTLPLHAGDCPVRFDTVVKLSLVIAFWGS